MPAPKAPVDAADSQSKGRPWGWMTREQNPRQNMGCAMDNDESHEGRRSLTRRAVLGGAAAGGLTGPLPAAARAANTEQAPSSSAVKTSEIEVFADPTINLQVLFALGGAAYGAS